MSPEKMSNTIEAPLDYTHALFAIGQGSQEIGMGTGMAGEYREAAAVWKEADQLLLPTLGYSFRRFVWHEVLGDQKLTPEETQHRLMLTENAQLAVIIDGLARTAALAESGLLGRPGLHAYNSVGIISAAVNAGSLCVKEAIELGVSRGRAFRTAIDHLPAKTTMFVLIGLPDERIEDTRRKFGLEYCLLNGVGQTVLGGEMENQTHHDVKHALIYLEEQGLTKQVINLNVEAAFHSRFFDEAVEPYQKAVKGISITAPTNGRLYGGTSVGELVSGEDVSNELVLQINHTENTRGVWDLLRKLGVAMVTETSGVQRFMGILKRQWKGNFQALKQDNGPILGFRWSAA